MASSTSKRKMSDLKSESQPYAKKVNLSPPEPPSLPLSLSSLIWFGKPTLFDVQDGEPIDFGAYITGQKTSLIPTGWSSDLMVYVYKTTSPHKIEYKRETYMGTYPEDFRDFGGDWGDPDPDPLLFLHRQDDQNPLSALNERIWEHSDRIPGPPYNFKTTSEEAEPSDAFSSIPENPPLAQISMPDLQLHNEAEDLQLQREETGFDMVYYDPELDHVHWDENRGMGFEGRWARTFISCVKENRSLGMLEKTVWTHRADSTEELWGMKLILEPVIGSVRWREDYDSDTKTKTARLASYRIRATILEVYVKPEYINSEWLTAGFRNIEENPIKLTEDDLSGMCTIVACKMIGNKLNYKVDCGFGTADPEWFTASNFKTGPEKLRDFHIRNPKAAGPPRRLLEWIQSFAQGKNDYEVLDDDNDEMREPMRGEFFQKAAEGEKGAARENLRLSQAEDDSRDDIESEPAKRGRGRPRKQVQLQEAEPIKRGRGRPRKHAE